MIFTAFHDFDENFLWFLRNTVNIVNQTILYQEILATYSWWHFFFIYSV